MIADGRSVENGAVLQTDVCIVGAGPAGLSVASELMNQSNHVLMVESGGLDNEPSADALSQLEHVSPDFDSPNQARRRQFGGMASSWDTALPNRRPGAKYAPLDAIDFEQRDGFPYSGWPFGRAELLPFYARAEALCGLGATEPSLDELAADKLIALPTSNEAVVTRVHQLGPARAFTVRMRKAIERSRNVTALMHATVTTLEQEREEQSVGIARIHCLQGPNFCVRARIFILAMGAIENARLLLVSGQQPSTGLRNSQGNVGRYYMDHHYVLSGVLAPHDIALVERAQLYDVRSWKDTAILGKLVILESTMRRESLLNSSVLLQPVLRAGYGRVRLQASQLHLRSRAPGGHSRTLESLRAAAQYAFTGAQLAWWQRRLQPRLSDGSWSYLPGNRRRFDSFALIHQLEQAPCPENRITLGTGIDDFGLRIPRLCWRWSDLDVRSFERVQQIFKTAFERSGVGIMSSEPDALAAEFARRGLTVPGLRADNPAPWLLTRSGAHHHLGTTRMHRDPKQGVVDQDCRVHEISNVFVAGGSVFPTGGYANPTLTVVALAIRLADHVKTVLGE